LNEFSFFHFLLIAWFGIAGVILVTLFFVIAPYGRHTTRNWGPMIQSKLGWIIMESTAPIIFAVCFILSIHKISITGLAFLVLWEAHYIHRSYIYPFSRRDGYKPMPLAVISLGFLFNSVNGYLNGRYLFSFSGGCTPDWLTDPRFIIGVVFFLAGFIINRQSDRILSHLRQSGYSGYQIAKSGFFRWVSCPNYLGEIIIWVGWAMATWSLAGVSFAVWTAANLVPRARSHHLWYQKNFPAYPPERKSLIPGIW
jgi:3-oxo-5-alpha-steroid 4-dehydrogenase 1